MVGSGLTPEQYKILFGDSPTDAPDATPPADPTGEANLSASDYLSLFGDSPSEHDDDRDAQPVPVSDVSSRADQNSGEIVPVNNSVVPVAQSGGLVRAAIAKAKSHPVVSSAVVVGVLIFGSAAFDDREVDGPVGDDVTTEVEADE